MDQQVRTVDWELSPFEPETRCNELGRNTLPRLEPGLTGRLKHIDTYLHDAAREGNLTRVKAAVENLKFDPLETDSTGETPLHKAVRCGQHKPLPNAEYLEVARYLANECKSSPKILNGTLQLASSFAEPAIIRLLIGLGAKPINATRAVFFASMDNDRLTALLDCCDINSCEFHGETALWWAVELNRLEQAERLINHKARVDIKGGHDHFSPLTIAHIKGNRKMIKLLTDAE